MKRSIRPLVAAAALTVAVLGLVTAPGCSKDEATQEAAGEAGEAAAGTKEGAAAAAAPAKAKAKAAARSLGTARVEMPADVLGIAGSTSFKDLVTKSLSVANKVAPGQVPPNGASLALEGLKASLGLSDITWLAQDKPIRFFSVDPKAYAGKGQTALIPITDKDKVLASLKPEAKKDVDGHAATFEHQFATYYIDFVAGHVVLSDAADIFGKHKAFIEGPLLSWNPPRPLSVQAHLENVNRIFGAEIDEAKRSLGAMIGQMAQDPDLPDSREVLELQIAMLFALLETSDTANVHFWVEGEDIQASFGLRPKAGSALAAFTKTVSGKSCGFVDALPANTWFGAAAAMDTREIASLRELSRKSVTMYTNLLKLTPEDGEALGAIMDRITDQSTGDAAVAIHQDGPYPMAITGMMTVEDGAATQKAYGDLLDLLFQKGFALLKAEMAKDGSEIPPGVAEAKSLPELIKVVGGLLGAFGVTLEIVDQEQDGAKVAGLLFEADWDKLGIKEKEPEAYDILTRVVGKKLQLAFAFKGSSVGFGMGPSGIAKAVAVASGKREGGEPTLNRANKDNALAMTVRMDLTMKALSWIPDLAPLAAKIDALPKERSFALTGASDGAEAVFTLTVPADVVAGLVAFGG